jgi:outer membrane lipoprotein SlyB
MKRILLASAVLIVLSACATPDVDTTAPTFDKTQYTADLDNCRGGTVIKVTLDGFVGAVYGSAIGALHGAVNGAAVGDAPEGAFIGAIAGSVIGVVLGAYEPFDKQKQSVQQCLRGKGYVLGATS